MAWKVKFFQTSRGDYPAQDFIDKQDMKTQSKVALSIGLLANQGPFLKPPYVKKFQDKLYELRISGKVAIRIFYTIQNNEYYLIHGFKKKSQKIPNKELKVALDRLKEFI